MTYGFDPETLAFYAKEAPVYVGSRPDDPDPDVAAFLDLLPDGAHILELGCGGGRDAKHMLGRGFIVDPTDGVAAMAAEAQAYLGIPVPVMRFADLDVDERYDAVIACASLLHVPRADLPAILVRIWRALRPGGWHFASYKTGGNPGHDEFGRYYNYPNAAEAQRWYGAAGAWRSIRCEQKMGHGYFSKPARWVTVIAQKTSA